MLRRRPRRSTRARLMRCVVLSFATLNRARKAAAAAAAVAAGRRRCPSRRCGSCRRRRSSRRPGSPSEPGGRGDELDADRAGGARRHDGATAGAADDAEVRGRGAAQADAPTRPGWRRRAGSGTPKLVTVAPCAGRRRAERLAAEVEPRRGRGTTGTGGPASLPATTNASVVRCSGRRRSARKTLLLVGLPVTRCGVAASPTYPRAGPRARPSGPSGGRARSRRRRRRRSSRTVRGCSPTSTVVGSGPLGVRRDRRRSERLRRRVGRVGQPAGDADADAHERGGTARRADGLLGEDQLRLERCRTPDRPPAFQ